MSARIDIEKIVLGAMLLSEENYWAAIDILSVSLFTLDDHQKIYVVMSELASSGKRISASIVASRVGTLSNGQDPDAYISMLIHVATKEENLQIRDYLDELREAATRRSLMSLAEGLLKAAKDPKQDPIRTIQRASERVADLSRNTAIEFEHTVSSTLKQIYEDAAKSGASGVALKPCLRGLEDMIGFLPPGGLVLWGGGPGSGKTAAAVQQALFTAEEHAVTLFELEMDNKSILARALSKTTGVSTRDLMRGLDVEQLQRLYLSSGEFEHNRLAIVSPPKMDINQLKAHAYAHRRKFGTKLFIVDHLKLLRRHDKAGADPVKAAYENAWELKELAKDLGATIIALCQLTKAARQKETPEPEMEDFYGGSLEEHADMMIANFNRYDWLDKNPPTTTKGAAKEIWEDNKQKAMGRIEFHKLKDRYGPSRDKRVMGWDGKHTCYFDLGGETDQLGFGGF